MRRTVIRRTGGDHGYPDALSSTHRQYLLAIVALSVLLNVCGIWWGLPARPESWAPDEFSPLRIRTALQQRFSNGWFELYPPVHVYALALSLFPIEALDWFGLVVFENPATYLAAFYIIRVVSVAMAIGLVVVMFEIGRELFGVRSGLFAGLTVSLIVPLVFYAKMANVEVPYLFWLALSLLFYIRILARHRLKDYALFAVTAALAIGTKDQAYALYLLLPFAIAASDLAKRKSNGEPVSVHRSLFNHRMFAALGVGVVALALLHNLAFNWTGAVERIRIITGPMTWELQEFPNSPAGHAGMLALAVRQLQFSFGWPLFVAAVVGLVLAARRWRSHRRALSLLLPIVSYWLFLIVPIMYHYDRYLLPVSLILSLFAGYALATLTNRSRRFRSVRLFAATIAIAFSVAYAASVDVLLVSDARYSAERWIRENVSRDRRVMAVGYAMYLPRFGNLEVATSVRPTVEELEHMAPDYLVLTSVFEEWRFRNEPASLTFFQQLRTGRLPYELVYSHWARPAISLLDLRGVRTNLDKVNPRIKIYRRVAR